MLLTRANFWFALTPAIAGYRSLSQAQQRLIPITDKNSNNIAMTFRGYDHGTESEWSGSTGGCQGVAKEGQDSRGAQSGTSHRVAAGIGFEFGADSGRHWALGGRNLHNAYPVWSCAGGRKESNAQQARAAQPGQGQSGARGADTGRSAERCRNGWGCHFSSPEAGHRGPTWKAVGVVTLYQMLSRHGWRKLAPDKS